MEHLLLDLLLDQGLIFGWRHLPTFIYDLKRWKSWWRIKGCGGFAGRAGSGSCCILLVRLLGKYSIGWISEPPKSWYLSQMLVLSQIWVLDVDLVPRPHNIPLNHFFLTSVTMMAPQGVQAQLGSSKKENTRNLEAPAWFWWSWVNSESFVLL